MTSLYVASPVPYITKIVPPRRRADTVRRERLLGMLHRSLDKGRVTVLSAPAGYGKTSLLTDFTDDLRLPVCWYSFDDFDGDPRTFLSYVVAAIQERFPNFGRRTHSLLETTPDIVPALHTIVGTLVTEMQTDILEVFVLVLEDLHWVDSQPVIQRAIDLLLRRLPENCQMLLSSRSRPTLPALASLTAQRRVTRLSAKDLAFTESEVEQFLQVADRDRAGRSAADLAQRSEGWIAGIVLSTQSPEVSGFWTAGLPDLSQDDLFLYLASDVLERLDPERQHFLLQSSILRELSVDLCRDVLGYERAAALLGELERDGLFLTSMELPGHYRYHALFQRFLLDRLRTAFPDEYGALHRTAGAYYDARGRWEEAVEHFLAAGRSVDAAAVLQRSAPRVYQAGQWSGFAGRVDAVWAAGGPRDPDLVFWRARCAVQLGEPDRALSLVALPDAVPAPDQTVRSAAVRELARSAALRAKGDTRTAFRAATQALDLLNAGPDVPEVLMLRADAWHLQGLCLAQQGHFSEALPALIRARKVCSASGDQARLANIHNHLAAVYHKLGQFAKAMSHYEQARVGLAELGNTAALASTLNNLGNLYLTQAAFPLAQDALYSALRAAQEAGSVRVEAYAAQSLGDALSGMGQPEAAIQAYSQGLDASRRAGEFTLSARTLVAMARSYLQLGIVDPAGTLVEEAQSLLGDRPGPYDAGLCAFAKGLLALNLEHWEDAGCILQEAVTHFIACGTVEWIARSNLLLAEAHFRLGRNDQALHALGSVRTAATDANGPALLGRESPFARDVLEYAVHRDPEGGTFSRLLVPATVESVSPVQGAGKSAIPRSANGKPLVRAFGLGPAVVEVDGRVVGDDEGLTAKARELLFYLMNASRWVRRAELIEALWQEADLSRGSSVLRTNVYRLRQALYADCVVVRGEHYRIDPDGRFWLDAHHFSELVKRGARGTDSEPEQVLSLETAVGIYRGPFLQESYSEWCAAKREELEERFHVALLVLARIHLSQGRCERSVELCERALDSDPYNEEAIALLVQSLVAAGDRLSAIARFKRFTQRVSHDLGESLSYRLANLAKQLERGESLLLN